MLKTTLHVQESCCKSNGGGRILLLRRVVQRSRISRLPRWQTRVTCPHPRRHTAVAREALRSHHTPARVHQMPEVVFCASPSAASAAAPRLRCRGMFSVWASAPHAPLCGVRVPATGHCACRYAHGPHVVAIKAGNFVALLRMTRKRQMQRFSKMNHATSAQHAPRTSRTHTTKQCL